MKKPFYLFSLVVLLLILSLPGVINRFAAESANRTYEVVMPLQTLIETAEKEEQPLSETLKAFQAAGLKNVQLDYLTLERMKDKQLISIYTDTELKEALRFTPEYKDSFLEEGIYISKPKQAAYRHLLENYFSLEYRLVGGERFYYFTNPSRLETFIGYDPYEIQLLHDIGINYVFLVPELENDDFDMLLKTYKHHALRGVLFASGEVAGFPDRDDMQVAGKILQDRAVPFYLQEFTSLAELSYLAKSADYQLIRLHAIHLGEKSMEESVQQAIRAVKERNIRSILVTLQTETEQEMDGIVFLEKLQQQMPSHFLHGNAQAFSKIEAMNWIQPLLLFTATLFSYGLLNCLNFNKLRIAAIFVLIAVGASWIITGYLLLLKLFAWLIAVLTVACAVLISAYSRISQPEKESTVWIPFLQATAVTITGIMLIIGLLNGNAFITGVELFRGIKLLHLIPPLLVFLGLFHTLFTKQYRRSLQNLLHQEVRIWHVIVFLVLLAVSAYYLIRTGNSGMVSSPEIMIRHTLEELFYVRPRTKEFLIGYPTMIIGLYFLPAFPVLGRCLLVAGSIGFVSMVNTFTHFHTPLFVSLLRSIYGVGLGVAIGYLLLFLSVWIRQRWAK